tara:strand:- start:92 stop:706 length:615 start_codon:yes stop_codon:yes gene_type:complete
MDFTKIFVVMSLLKSSVNYVPTTKGTTNGAAAARARRANVRRVRADNTQQRDRQRLAALQREMNRANRLHQEREANRTATLIGNATLQRQQGQIQRKKIAAIKRKEAKLKRDIAGPLRESMERAFQKVTEAEEALDKAKQEHAESVETINDVKRELGGLAPQLTLEEAYLEDLKRNYDDMPAAARFGKAFEADLAARVLDLSLE